MKRISIITGASAGLGREYALQLTQQRNLDEIWLLARRKSKLEELAQVASLGARAKVVDGKNPAAVVTHSLSSIKKKKHFAIMAPNWKIKAFLSRFISRFGYARYSYKHEKRPSN